MIPQSNISRLSNRLAKAGGRRIPEAVLERDYCIAWFLVALGRSSLCKKLAFKGGTALRRCHFEEYRFSEDLDFTLIVPLSFENLQKSLVPVYQEIQHASAIVFQFSRQDPGHHSNCFTFYLRYDGPLPTVSSGKEVKVDVTIKEEMIFPIENRIVLKSYVEYEDLPNDQKIQVYSLQEIATEKTIALMDRARNEPRDLYDLWYLIKNGISLLDLSDAINKKLKFRGKELAEVKKEFQNKEARLRKAWATRLSTHMVSLPQFDDVFRIVKREFRQSGF